MITALRPICRNVDVEDIFGGDEQEGPDLVFGLGLACHEEMSNGILVRVEGTPTPYDSRTPAAAPLNPKFMQRHD